MSTDPYEFHRTNQDYQYYYWLELYPPQWCRRQLVRKGYSRHYITLADLILRDKIKEKDLGFDLWYQKG